MKPKRHNSAETRYVAPDMKAAWRVVSETTPVARFLTLAWASESRMLRNGSVAMALCPKARPKEAYKLCGRTRIFLLTVLPLQHRQ